MAKIGIIGGSGLDNPDILKDARDVEVETPYGRPSSRIKLGRIGPHEVALLARHGLQHTIPPTQVNNRANIRALQDQGCQAILATTAVGSLREEIGRGHLVVIDQFIDFTRLRKLSFFDEFPPHAPVHTPMADPFDARLRGLLVDGCERIGVPFHRRGTVVTIEGPRFSTRAESHMFRAWGAHIINMSIAPECILANEARVPYAAVAMSTDYDCWKEDEEAVSWDQIIQIFSANASNVTRLLVDVIERF